MTEAEKKKQRDALATVAGAFGSEDVELNDTDRAAVEATFRNARIRGMRKKTSDIPRQNRVGVAGSRF